MLTESRLVYLIIYVNDLRVSRAFYEQALGFRVLEADDSSVKYDAGHIILCLNRAEDYGITLAAPRDRSADITFLVDDLDGMRAALDARGVAFAPTMRYVVGASADFYDPDGHWFSLYEPSEQALTWPSGGKIQTFLNANGGSRNGQPPSPDQSASPERHPDEFRLDGKDLIYLFLFMQDAKKAFDFYHHTLGLQNIEGGPCKRGATMEVDGVIKYDAGGTILTTHHVDDHVAVERELNPAGMKGIAPVFHVANMQQMVQELSVKGVQFSYGPTQSEIGAIAQFEDPCGHLYYLYEPSSAALTWPSGAKIKQILAAPL